MLEFLEKPGVVIVLLVALVVFGSKRLPDSARSLGRSMRILKAGAKGLKDDDVAVAPVAVAPVASAMPEPAPLTPPAVVPAAVVPTAERPDQQRPA
ncbi:MAG: Sec-independent protein translocase subunit TatA [Pseudorhodobacter sp.]|nr:Sec-independent protein translocase subunit TatA [Frankiaceae bacterium]